MEQHFKRRASQLCYSPCSRQASLPRGDIGLAGRLQYQSAQIVGGHACMVRWSAGLSRSTVPVASTISLLGRPSKTHSSSPALRSGVADLFAALFGSTAQPQWD